ncbi:MAG: hypothetical protein JNM34_11230 [Chthonomonadaceae bacterium]|nr:hypothetical protein [Chthonomonadaceae bacterium]
MSTRFQMFRKCDACSAGATCYLYDGWNPRWGYYYDSETGLYLCQQRYYDSNQGRWLNRDPIRYRGGLNLYGYCGGSPVGRIDVTGTNFQFMILVAEDQDVAPPIAPPRFNIEENLCTVMKEAFLIYSTDDLGLVKFEKAMKWFKEQVKSGGVWDYKHGGHKEYENLGNWNYGATGSYLGLSDDTLLRGAGLYQKIYGTSTDAWGGPLGGPPYGDDPNDQYWIRKGIKFIQERGR